VKKGLTILLSGVAALIVVGGAALAWTYQKATALPDWYVEQEESSAPLDDEPLPPPAEVEIRRDRASKPSTPPERAKSEASEAERPAADSKKKRSAATNRGERNFHRRTMLGQSAWAPAILGSRLVYENGKLEATLIVSVARIDRSKLAQKELAALDRALALVPDRSAKTIALSLVDRPTTESDGSLQLTEKAKVSLGELPFDLDSLSTRLGGNPAATKRSLSREFSRLIGHDDDDR
jgi:hypothetical protein